MVFKMVTCRWSYNYKDFIVFFNTSKIDKYVNIFVGSNKYLSKFQVMKKKRLSASFFRVNRFFDRPSCAINSINVNKTWERHSGYCKYQIATLKTILCFKYINKYMINRLYNHKLTHFRPMFHFYTPWKYHKTKGFLWGIDVGRWPEMD